MIITNNEDLRGMQKISHAVAHTLQKMKQMASIGMTSKALDEYGASVLASFGARSAPKLAYDFPGHTCISINNEIAHGVPSADKILKDGDLINIDVSAELDGFWSDNGGSFVLGEDLNNHLPLVRASQTILQDSLSILKEGLRISKLGRHIERGAKAHNLGVIRNLAGHGIGRGLHEKPDNILNYENIWNFRKFKKDMVVAIETFVSTKSTNAKTTNDGWTLIGNKGGYVAQHEHTIIVTEGQPIILTEDNGIYEF